MLPATQWAFHPHLPAQAPLPGPVFDDLQAALRAPASRVKELASDRTKKTEFHDNLIAWQQFVRIYV
jgi:hypothetical protein